MMPYASPVAYIRRSVSRTGDRGDVSREFQTEAVRALANGDGPSLRIIDGDWGKSGGRKAGHLRAAFLGMLADVEAGKVSTIYAYAEDRLARDVEASVRLLNACERNGVVIVTRADTYAPGDPRARRRFIDEANDNEYALSKMTEKASDTATKRKERGDVMGRAPYGYQHKMIDGRSQLVPREGESPATVVEAFRLTGAYNQAAKLLNGPKGEPVVDESGRTIGIGYGLPTRFEGKRWDPTTVRHVVLREEPELAPVRTRRGASTRSTRLFAGLLRCPHAETHPMTPDILTSSVARYQAKGTEYGHTVRYYCRTANMDQSHPRPYIVAETKILPWAEAELADYPKRMRTAARAKDDPSEKLAALEERRERVIANFEDGDITRDQKKARLAAIDAEVATLEPARRAVGEWRSLRESGAIPPPDPRLDQMDPAEANAFLRRIWDHIELDPATMLPVRAVWTVGEEPRTADTREAEKAAE